MILPRIMSRSCTGEVDRSLHAWCQKAIWNEVQLLSHIQKKIWQHASAQIFEGRTSPWHTYDRGLEMYTYAIDVPLRHSTVSRRAGKKVWQLQCSYGSGGHTSACYIAPPANDDFSAAWIAQDYERSERHSDLEERLHIISILNTGRCKIFRISE